MNMTIHHAINDSIMACGVFAVYIMAVAYSASRIRAPRHLVGASKETWIAESQLLFICAAVYVFVLGYLFFKGSIV